MTHTKTAVCPRCGKPMSSVLPGGSCPKCLMALAINGGSYEPTAAASPGSLDHGHVPPIEQLVTEFPNLEIQHLIGHGGMGAVYQARQINLDRIVALKILAPRLSCDPAFAERFLREARTLAKLAHPNIVTVFDFGQAGSFYYLTMEFVDGVNLRDTISAKLLSPSEALAIVPQVCEALQYAHDQGVVHRDIKPENILIAKSGGIKIADFGLAKLLQATPDQFTLTGTRQILGTRNYMAPEQIESPDVVDHRADLYSLGVVFYELLTGELPLGRFSLPSEKSASVSNLLDDVVMRTLEKDPNRRYQQASQIKTACESIKPPQPNGKPGAEDHQYDDAKPICTPFPITIEELFAGFASGFGLLRGFETHLELEYEVRDSVVDHKWGGDKIQVPLDRVTSMKMHEGLIYTYLEVQADRFEVVSEIPNSKLGSFRVYLKKKDRPHAELLTRRVNDIVYNLRNPGGTPPMPPVKANVFVTGWNSRDHSFGLGGAVLLVLFLGFCGFLAALVLYMAVWTKARHEPAEVLAPSGQSEIRAPVDVITPQSAPESTLESELESKSNTVSDTNPNKETNLESTKVEAESNEASDSSDADVTKDQT